MKTSQILSIPKLKIVFLSLFFAFNFCQIQTLSAAVFHPKKEVVDLNNRQLKKEKKQKKLGFIQRILIKRLKKKFSKIDLENKEKKINRAATISWTFGAVGFTTLIFSLYVASFFLLALWALIAIIGLLFGLIGVLNSNDELEKYYVQRRLAYIGIIFGAPFILLPIYISYSLFIGLITLF